MSGSSKGKIPAKKKADVAGKKSKNEKEDEDILDTDKPIQPKRAVQKKAPKSQRKSDSDGEDKEVQRNIPAAAGKSVKQSSVNHKQESKQNIKKTTKEEEDSEDEDDIPVGKREAKQKPKPKTNGKTAKQEIEENSDDEDIDEDRAAIGEDVMNRMFGMGEKKGMGGIDAELANMNLPRLSKMIPAKGMSKVIDSMTNDMLNNNNLDVDQIVDASMQASGKKLRPQEREMARKQASKLLSQLNPSIQTCNFLSKILLIGIKYSLPGKHGKGIGNNEGMKEYHQLISKTLNNKNSEMKMKHATSHSETVKRLFEAFKDIIREYEDHSWIEKEGEIILSYGKNQTAILPLTDIYSYISNLDREHVARLEKNKEEKKEETIARKEVENDAGELDHHLWKLFSLATDSQDERNEYEDRALHLVSGGDATKKDIVDVSRRLREKFIEDKSNYDANGEVIPAVLVGKVINHLDETGEINGTIKNVITGLDKGNFDLMSTISQAKRDLLKDEEKRGK